MTRRDFLRHLLAMCLLVVVDAAGTVVPEAAVPETAVPETAVPETAVPETAVFGDEPRGLIALPFAVGAPMATAVYLPVVTR